MNRIRQWFFSVLITAVVVTMAACGGGGSDETPVPSPNITVSDSVTPDNDHTIPFGSVTDGSSSDETVTVTNAGTADLDIGTVTSPAAPFTLMINNCSGQTLAPGGTCTVTVRFSPSAETTYTGSFGIPSNDPDTATVTVSVSGTGTAVPVPNIAVTDSVAPDNDHTIPFGDVVTGDTSDETVTVTNTGTADLIIGTPAPFAVPFGVISQTCWGQTIAPNGTCTVTVGFSPSAETTYTGSFGIPSNDPDTALHPRSVPAGNPAPRSPQNLPPRARARTSSPPANID